MTDTAIPAFAGKARTESYYETVNQTIRALRRMVTNREIASRLNAKSLTTPRGNLWNRERVAQYIRNQGI